VSRRRQVGVRTRSAQGLRPDNPTTANANWGAGMNGRTADHGVEGSPAERPRKVRFLLGLFVAGLGLLFAAPAASATETVVYGRFIDDISRGSEVWAADGDGRNPRFVANGEFPALSPDGTKIAYIAKQGSQYQLATMDVSGASKTIVLAQNGALAYPAWSPSGDRLVFTRSENCNGGSTCSRVYTINTNGTSLTCRIDAPQSYWPSFSPDGSTLAWSKAPTTWDSGAGIYVASASSTCGSDNRRQLISWDTLGGAADSPAISRDGTRIAFEKRYGEIYTIRMDGTDLRLVGKGDSPDWTPDGRIVFYDDQRAGDVNTTGVTVRTEYGMYTMRPDGTDRRALVLGPVPAYPEESRFWEPTYRQASTGQALDLLQAYRPLLMYDLNEKYFADSAAGITNNVSNRLVRGNGSLIAQPPALSLSYLGATYPGGAPAYATDHLIEGSNYENDAQAIHDSPNGNKIYGRLKLDSSGNRWLQYWFFYYYNSYAVAGVGTHEGDWEMIQVRLDSSDHPDRVTYAKHTGAESCNFDDPLVKKYISADGIAVPTVYVAAGSHASYVQPGIHDTPDHFVDYADGWGEFARPDIESVIQDGSPSWVAWPGSWGNSGGSGLNQASPRGPAFQGVKWTDPDVFDLRADSCNASE
jgi:hypothetical protein